MTEHLVGAVQDIEQRLSELREEARRLEAAHAALTGPARASRTPAGQRRRAPARKPRRPARGRPRGSGARTVQTEKLVRENPGITVNELARRMRIKPNTCIESCLSCRRLERSARTALAGIPPDIGVSLLIEALLEERP
jgi:hypothetical protein